LVSPPLSFVVAVVSAATAATSKSREIKVDFLYYQLRITLESEVSHRMLAEDPLWLTTMLLELLWYYCSSFALYVQTFSSCVISLII
jgi:hypothetical protein